MYHGTWNLWAIWPLEIIGKVLYSKSANLIFSAHSRKDLVALWHIYRVPIILTAFTALMILRTYLHLRSPREKLPQSPLPASPALLANTEKVSVDSKTMILKAPRRIVGGLKKRKSSQEGVRSRPQKIQVLVFFSSLTGTTEKTAKAFTRQISQTLTSPTAVFLEPQLHDLSYIDYDDYFISPPKADPGTSYFYLLLIPTYNIDTVLDNFLEHLQETHNDFRIDTAPLSPLLGYSVFGFGDRDGWPTEEEGFCSQARDVDKWMAKLTGRKRAFPLGMGDSKTDAADRLKEWKGGVEDVLNNIAETGGLGEGVVGSGDAVESDLEDVDEDDGEVLFDDPKVAQRKTKVQQKNDSLNDLEDIGGSLGKNQSLEATDPSEPLEVDFTTYNNKSKSATTNVTKEMVPKDSPTYIALTKQGYSIVGSHSGVKICRWTKSALRGRGSCYKYSFYGIASHQCMETTPSLSCSNKCVFCWRHGTNPVGTTWRWRSEAHV